jgi:hypothetical protein
MAPELLKDTKRYKNVLSIVNSSDWMRFMATFIGRFNLITNVYWMYLLFILIGTVFLFFTKDLIKIDYRFWVVGISGGLLISLLISPILHELVHGLSYKLLGVEKIKFKWNWKLLRFDVQAFDFAISKSKYYLICAITLFLFSVIPFMLAVAFSGEVIFGMLSLSFFHALYSIKDIAICSYLYKFKNCFIYNSSDENKTVFYKSLS